LQPVTSAQVAESQNYNALWLWVKAHRAEVASLAEAQLGIQSAGMNLSLQSPSLELLDKTPDKTPGSSVLKSALQYAHTPDTPSPPKFSLRDGLTPTTFLNQPTQLSALPVSSPASALSPACQCEFETFFFYTLPI
jgi:hypothetical protein